MEIDTYWLLQTISQWTECFAIPNMEASTVATKIAEEVITRFGVPAVIHSDQGQQY